MKKVPFDTVNVHVKKLHQKHKKLKSMTSATSHLIKKVRHHIEKDAALENEPQIRVFQPWHVKSHTAPFKEKPAQKLEKPIKEKGHSMDVESIYTIFIEILSLHVIVYYASSKE